MGWRALAAAALLAGSLTALAADRQTLADGVVSLELPSAAWKLSTEPTDSPVDVGVIEHTGSSGRGKLGLQAVGDAPFSALVPAVEQAFADKYQEFQKLESATETVGGNEVFRIESTFTDEGKKWQAVAFFTKTADGQLFSFSFRAAPDELPKLRAELDQLVASFEVGGHRLVAGAKQG